MLRKMIYFPHKFHKDGCEDNFSVNCQGHIWHFGIEKHPGSPTNHTEGWVNPRVPLEWLFVSILFLFLWFLQVELKE